MPSLSFRRGPYKAPFFQLIGDLPFRVWVKFREKPAGAFKGEFARLVVKVELVHVQGGAPLAGSWNMKDPATIQTITPATATRLDSREEHFRIPSGINSCGIFLRYLPALPATGSSRVVLYVHGATFSSALSIAHRFDGRSWRDDLAAAGYHVWGFDFLGYGASDRFREMELPAEANLLIIAWNESQ